MSLRDANTRTPRADLSQQATTDSLCKMAVEVANGSQPFTILLGVVGVRDCDTSRKQVRAAAVYAVLAYIQHGGEVDAIVQLAEGMTLLRMSALSGQAAVCKLLLCNGADPDLAGGDDQGTALMSAAQNGQTTTVQILLEAKADTSLRNNQGRTALDLAEMGRATSWEGDQLDLPTREGDHPAAAALLRKHAAMYQAVASPPPATADVECSPFFEFGSMHCFERVQFDVLFARRMGKCLLTSVRIHNLTGRPELNGRLGQAVRYDLARERYEVQVQGEAQSVMLRAASLQVAGAGAELPAEIFVAVGNGDRRAVTAWLAQGGQVDARCLEDGAQMWTMLHAAVVSEQTMICKLLLRRLANPDLREITNENTALLLAATRGHTDTVNALLEAKADVCLCDRFGRTALSRGVAYVQSRCAAPRACLEVRILRFRGHQHTRPLQVPGLLNRVDV